MKISSKLSLSSDFVLLWYFTFTCWNWRIHSELYAGAQFCLTLFHFTFREVCRFWTSFWRKLGWRVASRIMGHWNPNGCRYWGIFVEDSRGRILTTGKKGEVVTWMEMLGEVWMKILWLIICGLDPRWPLRQRPSCLDIFYVFLHVLWLLRLAVAS